MNENVSSLGAGLPFVVLGANGFLGSHFVDSATRAGYRVFAVDRFSDRRRRYKEKPFKEVKAELPNTKRLSKELPAGSIFVDATRSTTPWQSQNLQNPQSVLTASVQLEELMDLVISRAGKAFVFCSSGGAYYGESPENGSREEHSPSPSSGYGELKVASEAIVREQSTGQGLDYRIFRFGNVYGERQQFKGGQGLIPRVVACALSGEPLPILGSVGATRDYVHVDDAVYAAMAVLTSDSRFRVYNVGTGIGYSIADVIELVEGATGRRVKQRFEEAPDGFAFRSVLNIERLSSEFRYLRFRSLPEGVHRYVEIVSGGRPA